MTRRDLLKAAMALPAASWMSNFRALAAPHQGKVKITAVKSLGLTTATGNCLIRIETDAGLTGYGEAGATGPMARARIKTMTDRGLLIGKDPLAIEYHFHEMTSLMHTYLAHIPTISGIDIALWDLAGKITGLPVVTLLGGPFRDAIPMYSHGDGFNMLDKGACRDWAARIKSAKEGFKAFKFSVDKSLGIPAGRYAVTLTREQLKNCARAYLNAREAAGDDIDIAVHGHGELDTPSAIAVAKATEPMDPLFFEDGINVAYSEGWASLKRSTRIPILTGEKLEMLRQFKPYLDTQSADIIHPDLAFAGGLTGTRKIADYAQLTRTPVALHNVGSLVLTYASAHFGASFHNFYRSESALGRPTRQVEDMANSNPPSVAGGLLKVPEGAGLGLDLNVDFLRRNLSPGEPFWEG